MHNLIEYIVKALVDDPEQVVITEIPGLDGVTYEVHVGPGDLGKVIGKQGRIANALRTVAKASSGKGSNRVFVEIMA